MRVSKGWTERYARQLILPEVGGGGQQKISGEHEVEEYFASAPF
jgi:molybdopterin/thiamine biosynthesis adenylyltransferase